MASKKNTPAPAAVAPAPAGPVKPAVPAMKIFALQVENIKRVTFARIRPTGDMVFITGNNGSGKSSVLDAIEWGITGTSHVPSQPIKKGKTFGKIEIDLGDFKLTRHFSRVDPEKSAKGNTYHTTLKLEGKNREMFRSPQELLDGFMGRISFDPLEFIRMKADKQLLTLRELVTLDVDLDKLEAEKKEAYDLRRECGKDVDSLTHRLASMPAPPDGLPDKAVDTEAITAELQGAAQRNSERAQAIASRSMYERKANEAQHRATQARQRAIELRKQAEEMDKVAAVEDDAAEDAHISASKVVIPEEVSTAELAARLNQANTINQAITRRESYLFTQKQKEQADKLWAEKDAIVKAKDAERTAAIARAKMPIPGLAIGDGEVLYNELPFEQASNAEQIAVSTSLAMASNPKLRVLRIKDGSLLDQSSLELIANMAAKNDYQVWIERVDANGVVGVVMEDGEASGPGVEKVVR